MDRIELQMDKTVFVLGAGITASLKHKNDGLMQEYITRLHLENTAHSNALLVQTQLEPMLFHQPSSDGLSLADFQRKGALLAYLYADKTIDQALDQSSLTATNVDKWVEQSTTGIMHLFGVCNDIDSMQYLENDTTVVPDSLLHVFKHKVCVCIGFDQEGQTDLQTFLNQLPLNEMPNVLLPCSCMSKIEATLGLPISVANVFEKLSPVGNSAKALGERLDHNDHSVFGQPLSLLMSASKTADYVKTAMLLSTLPGMNFQLMNNVECNGASFRLLTVQVEYKKFREFWCALMQPSIMESLVNQTVLAIVLNQFTFIWLRTAKGLSVTTDMLPTALPKALNGHNKYSLLVHATKQIKMVRSKYSASPKSLNFKRSTNDGKNRTLRSINNCHNSHATTNTRPLASNSKSNVATKDGSKKFSTGMSTARKSQPLHSIHNNTRLVVNKGVKPYETLRILLQKPLTNKFKSNHFYDEWPATSTTKQKQFITECREWSLKIDKLWQNKKKTEKAKKPDKVKSTEKSHKASSPTITILDEELVATGTMVTSTPHFSSLNHSRSPFVTTQQSELTTSAVATSSSSRPFSAIQPSTSKSIFSTAAVAPIISPFMMPPPTPPCSSTPNIAPNGIAPSIPLPVPPSLHLPRASLAPTPSIPVPNIPVIARIPPSLPIPSAIAAPNGIPPTLSLLRPSPLPAPNIPPTIPLPPNIPAVTPAITPSLPTTFSTPAFAPPNSITPCIPLRTATTPIMYPASAYLSATSYPFLPPSVSVNFPYLFRNPSNFMLTQSNSLPHTQDQVPMAVKRALVNHDSDSEDNQRLPFQKYPRVSISHVALSQSLSPSSDKDESSPSTYAMSCDSPDEIDIEEDTIPLWKFIIELLLLNSHSHVISWRQVHSLEFQIKQPLELVRVWGSYKHEESQKSTECNYKKFRGALHYYSIKDQPILRCISVKDEIYRFSDSMLKYINNRYLMLKKNEASVFNFSSLERDARCP